MKIFYVSCACALALQIFTVFSQASSLQNVAEGRTLRVRRDVNKIETVVQAVDVALREIHMAMLSNKMDPFHAPNQTESLGPLNQLVYLTMTNVMVYNLSTIKRADDVIVLDDPDERKLTFQVKLTFDDLQVKSDYKSSAFLIASIGQISAKIPEVLVDFTLQIDFKAMEISMTKFKLTKNDSQIQVHFSGNIESLVLNFVMGLATTILGNVIMMILEGPVRKEINKVLAIINKVIQESMLAIGS